MVVSIVDHFCPYLFDSILHHLVWNLLEAYGHSGNSTAGCAAHVRERERERVIGDGMGRGREGKPFKQKREQIVDFIQY